MTLTATQRDYTLAALGLNNVREFDVQWAATLQPDGSDPWRLLWMPYLAFREQFGLVDAASGRPARVTLIGADKLRFDLVPDMAYKARLS